MATNSVENILSGAKKTLANAQKFTQSVEGNPTSSFAPKKTEAPKIPQVHNTPYSAARQLRSAGDNTVNELKQKSDNINRYMEATK